MTQHSPRFTPGAGFDGIRTGRLAVTSPSDMEMTPLADVRTADAVQAGKATPSGTPLVAKLASQLGVPLDQVAGTGTGGRITAADVRTYAARAEEDRLYSKWTSQSKEN